LKQLAKATCFLFRVRVFVWALDARPRSDLAERLGWAVSYYWTPRSWLVLGTGILDGALATYA